MSRAIMENIIVNISLVYTIMLTYKYPPYLLLAMGTYETCEHQQTTQGMYIWSLLVIVPVILKSLHCWNEE
jgi:hypothetical protein